MSDIWASIIEYFKSRAKSQVYGVFGFWWVVLHIGYVTTLLFVDQQLIYQKTHLLKNEYLAQTYLDYTKAESWLRLLAVMVMTFLTLWLFPKIIFNPSYGLEKSNQLKRQKIKIKYEKDLLDAKADAIKREVGTLTAELQKNKLEETVEGSKQKIWGKDYEEFKKSTLYSDFDEIRESIYEHYGSTMIKSNGEVNFSVNSELLAYANSNDLVDFDSEEQTIRLTDKGKYFIKTYQLENN